ncbi:zinc-dependent alcohol dehydrogenase [Oenococcus oeni]|uniref:Sorbitol dehydrogenase n=2 Tax=Oenococcus oeni TaxID=1247 RepID=A0NK51_OENOE|nr:alcohol dehydrogenase catalytic domain-containing protein [Oenococcus oeni]EAV39190.1 sorbitol dehydrogenase [Oenococcus oeni ATCC BAA-1163]KDE87711.1 theronine dehydrogenase [Oenococcus oeni]OIL21508.1 theronine dehydrogenase [Oenococcus oeni]OIL26907.1 theronine dehydrogenase [Oenococcus oeni]OIL43269.1 theronine dehydrogenase [Oenococcus oeni]
MKAAVYEGKKAIKMTELPTPKAGPNDVVIQNIYAGICGSDVAVYNHGSGTGHKIETDHEFGHEAVSKVVEVGDDVHDFKIGDRVYPYPLLARGDPSRAGSMGGFSEYILIPNAKLNRQLYLVPKEIDNHVAAMIEPFTVGTRAAKQTRPDKNDNAIVYGAGTIGMAAAVALKHLGVKQVMLVDLSDYRLNVAKELGFLTVNSSRDDVRSQAIEAFGKAEYSLHGEAPDTQIFLDAAGHNSILEDFLQFGPVGSRFVTIGVNNSKPQIDFLELIFGSKSVGGSGGYRPEDVQTVFEIMKERQSDLRKMVSQEFDWQDLEKGIQTATDTTISEKVLINYHL